MSIFGKFLNARLRDQTKGIYSTIQDEYDRQTLTSKFMVLGVMISNLKFYKIFILPFCKLNIKETIV